MEHFIRKYNIRVLEISNDCTVFLKGRTCRNTGIVRRIEQHNRWYCSLSVQGRIAITRSKVETTERHAGRNTKIEEGKGNEKGQLTFEIPPQFVRFSAENINCLLTDLILTARVIMPMKTVLDYVI